MESLKNFFQIAVAVAMGASFIVCLVASVALAIATYRLKAYLRVRHPEAWKALGEPQVNGLATIRATQRLFAVVRSNVAEEISDASVTDMLRKVGRLDILQSRSFVVCLGSLFALSVLLNV